MEGAIAIRPQWPTRRRTRHGLRACLLRDRMAKLERYVLLVEEDKRGCEPALLEPTRLYSWDETTVVAASRL
jgi:hypothetical protein